MCVRVCVCVQVEEAEVRVADSSGEAVANKTRLEVTRQQETLIKEEAAEKRKGVSQQTSHSVCRASVVTAIDMLEVCISL